MEKNFYNISEVSKIIGRNASTIRFWETKFNKIQPMKRSGGRRFYRPDDISLLKEINDLLTTQKLTIEGAVKQLNAKNNKIDKVLIDSLKDVLEDLKTADSILNK
ncbi:MAG: MerR family transcriptional regulator [Alphaproteobacteria bacterium]|jgi:DNA-binding transcriptional MerR regulator|nr:MerR family transcriptional regulator [Alphaproteobacteria bacterium]